MRQRDIEAANADPNAVFIASRFRLWGSPSYYRLGMMQKATERSDLDFKRETYERPDKLLIKWHFGPPAKPNTVALRGNVVDVNFSNLQAGLGNRIAVFTATSPRPHATRPYYVSGKYDLGPAASSEAVA